VRKTAQNRSPKDAAECQDRTREQSENLVSQSWLGYTTPAGMAKMRWSKMETLARETQDLMKLKIMNLYAEPPSL
jgi:hypothetical protein